MAGWNLSRFLLVFVLIALILPIGMGEVFANDANYNVLDDKPSKTRSGLERGSLEGTDEKTKDLSDSGDSIISGLSYESIANLNMEVKSLKFLGKDPNLALDSTNFFPVAKSTSSRGTRDEPADNNWQGANVLSHNMAKRNDSVGGTDSTDWYRIDLTTTTNSHDEVKIQFTNKETTRDRNITLLMYDTWNGYPLINYRTWAYSAGGNTYTPGGIPADTTMNITARAPRTGTYYMQIAPHPTLTGTFSYSIDKVTVTGKTPMDHNNQWESASKETSTTFLGSVRQNDDHWNWHNVSSHFANTGADYDNNLSYTMTITSESSGQIQELASVANFNWVSWTMVSVLYNNDDGDWFQYHHQFWTGGSDVARAGNTRFNPERGWTIVNGTFAYIGVETKSAFFWVDGNNNVHIDDWYTTGYAAYSMTIAVEEIDLNYKPQLNFGKVTPTKGSTTDNFTFEVKFTDLNNEEPVNINVTVDNKYVFPMETKTGESSNFDQGVLFVVKVRGDAIGDDPYPHTYRFRADDGRKIASPYPLSGDANDLYIYKNTPPVVHPDPITEWIMDEDDNPEFVDLYDVFYDPDGTEDIEHDLDGKTLDFELRDEEDTKWGTMYQDDIVQVTLFESGDYENNIRVQPLENKYGQSIIKLRATDESQYGDDIYEWYVETTMTITINPVNDAPDLVSVPDFTKISAGAIEQEDTWVYTFNATDVDDPVLMFSTDIEDVMTVGGENVLTTEPQEYGYSFDAFTGTITLVPTNDFVGKHTINVTVTDNDMDDPKTDWDTFVIEITNKNDPPKITAVGKKDVVEGSAVQFNAKQNDKMELQIYAEDPDIEIGEDDELDYELGSETPPRSNMFIDSYGEFTFIPDQNDVDNRTTYVTIVVFDSKKASDEVKLRIKVENVNDPPIADDVDIVVEDGDPNTPEPENLTIQFKVINPRDPDGDTITYSWDFDTSENLDKIGEADDDNELQGMENIIHTYPNPGEYEGMLTMKDAVGATVKINFTVEVKEPKEYFIPPPPPDKKDDDTGVAGMGKYAGMDVAYWVVVLVVILIVAFLTVMFVIRKKQAEIERERHAERFKQEELGMPGAVGPDGRPIRPEEGPGEEVPKFPEEAQVARSASELYQQDKGAAMPSFFDAQPQGLPPGGPPQQPQPLGLPPAAGPVQPQQQPMQQPPGGEATDMKCTSCGTPINPEWFICPGCHRFLK